MIFVLTAASTDRLRQVNILAQSIAAFLPAARFHWLVTDPAGAGPHDASSTRGSAKPPIEILDGSRLLSSLAGTDDETSIPVIARDLLLRPDCKGLLVMDAHTEVFSPLPELEPSAPAADVTLTPTLVRPEPVTTSEPPAGELRTLRSGVFSTGLIGVAPTANGERFLQWWGERARGYVPPPDNRHALRPWLNLAPALFAGIRVLRSPRLGVGRDNLHERRVEADPEGRFLVEGSPLGWFDYRGFDDGSLDTAIDAALGDHAVLQRIVGRYRERLAEVSSPVPVVAAGPEAPEERE